MSTLINSALIRPKKNIIPTLKALAPQNWLDMSNQAAKIFSNALENIKANLQNMPPEQK